MYKTLTDTSPSRSPRKLFKFPDQCVVSADIEHVESPEGNDSASTMDTSTYRMRHSGA